MSLKFNPLGFGGFDYFQKAAAELKAKAAGGLEIVGSEIGVKAKGVTDAMLAEVYALLAGRKGGQILSGGTEEADTLVLKANSLTPGHISVSEVAEADQLNFNIAEGASLILTALLTSPLAELTTLTLKGNANLSNVSITLTASKNNLEVGPGIVVRLKPNKALEITGLVKSGLFRWLILYNAEPFNVTLKNESASSEAINRFSFYPAVDIVLRPKQSLMLFYDGSTTFHWHNVDLPAPNTGTVTLEAGEATVTTSLVTASSRIFLTTNEGGLLNVGTPYEKERTAGTSFVIKSSNALDKSTVAWMLVEP